VLIEVGKLREGIRKYDALLLIPSTNPTIAAELESAKSSREKALKLLAASTTQPITPAPSGEKTIQGTDLKRKTPTIFR